MNTTETRTPTDADVADAIERSKREILDDIEAGIVPETVADFSELHDYVDANVYGGLCDEGPIQWLPDEDADDDGTPYGADAGNRVQYAVNDWLEAGRPSS